jgi:polar amino acid transport system substrate-binding protein
VRKDDTELKADLDNVIEEMKADGTLDNLVKIYITDVNPDNIPAVEIPTIDGAETIKIGLTGDLPPLDLVLADDSPAGFNTAMLAEIAKRLDRNIEIVGIDSSARAAALSSNQIDVVFWTIVPNGDKVPADIDKPDSIELSKPYFSDNVEHLKFNK